MSSTLSRNEWRARGDLNPGLRLTPTMRWSPEASVISKLHYGPISEVAIEDD
jgi:hypothetical protein